MQLAAKAGLLATLLIVGACTAGSRPAEQVSVISASATVEAVDAASRTLTLRDDATGEVFAVTAGPEVRNFAQIEAGDRVEIDFLDATVLEMAAPDEADEPVAVVAGARAPEGARPGAGGLVSTSVVVQLISYDAATAFATFRLPDGTVRRATLPPSLRSFAERLRPGERVRATLTDAVAVAVMPAAG
jgi:hypothetical protein